MSDIIQGPVIHIIDGDTFDMTVTHLGTNNREQYNNQERVRIANFNAPELGTIGGAMAKINLEKHILGKIVKCTVKARDVYGRIVANVNLV